MGEFSHVSLKARWEGARDFLVQLSTEPDDLVRRHTARGHVIDLVAYMLGHELCARLEAANPDLADGFRQTVTLTEAEEHDLSIERHLTRAYGLNGFDFGRPAFVSHDATNAG
ncbi:hypothetical protein AB0B63_16295 [Micromonospora sp. NPDC049081]|uniref:hypothetical protein n=1 Tax=Micromonospora sp. NPDC049081 TaxID=3155150 RepID=UPI0033C11533